MGKTKQGQHGRKRRAVSPVISTLIISAAILTVTVIASFLSLNMLELRSQQTEFSQASSNMQILSEIIEDTGVKPGAGSFIRFNVRTGGLGYETNPGKTLSLVILGNGGAARNITSLTSNPLNVTYRAGRLVSTFDEAVSKLNNLEYNQINGTNTLIIPGLASPMGLLTQRQENGAFLRLDFNRIRIVNSSLVNVGNDQYQLFTVTFFNVYVKPNSFYGSSNLEVKVQNNGSSTFKQYTYFSNSTVNIIATYDESIWISPGICEEAQGCFSIPVNNSIKGVIVMVVISDLDLSTLG